jgi:hypothetical protein
MATIRKRYLRWTPPDVVQRDDGGYVNVVRIEMTDGDLLELEIATSQLHDLIERLSVIDRLKHRPPI